MENVYSYADVLESYMIAEEGFGDAIKKAGSRIITVLKGLKDKIIQFFKRIVASIKSKSTKKDSASSERAQYALFKACLKDLQIASDSLLKATGIFNPVGDSNNAKVQSYLEKVNDCVQKVNDRIDNQKEWHELDSKIIDSFIKQADSIKNTYVHALNLSIVALHEVNYNVDTNTTRMTPNLANSTYQITSANSNFFKAYTRLLNQLKSCNS